MAKSFRGERLQPLVLYRRPSNAQNNWKAQVAAMKCAFAMLSILPLAANCTS